MGSLFILKQVLFSFELIPAEQFLKKQLPDPENGLQEAPSSSAVLALRRRGDERQQIFRVRLASNALVHGRNAVAKGLLVDLDD